MPVNRKKGSPRYGKSYKVGADGSHVYRIGGKRVVIGGAGKRVARDPIEVESRAEADMRFAPNERLLKGNIRQAEAHGQTIEAAFNSYRAHLQQAQEAEARNIQVAQSHLQQGTNAAAGVAAAHGKAAITDQAARAALLGQSGSATAAATSLSGSVQDRAHTVGGYAKGMEAKIGLADQASLARQGLIMDRQRIERRSQAQKAVMGERDKLLDLGREKIEYTGKLKSEKRQELAKNMLAYETLRTGDENKDEDRALKESLGLGQLALGQARLQETGRHNRATETNAQRKLRLDREKAAKAGGAKGRGRGLTPSEAKHNQQLERKYRGLAQTYKRYLRQTKGDKTRAHHLTGKAYKGRVTRQDLHVAYWLGVKGRLPDDLRNYLGGLFKGGQVPW